MVFWAEEEHETAFLFFFLMKWANMINSNSFELQYLYCLPACVQNVKFLHMLIYQMSTGIWILHRIACKDKRDHAKKLCIVTGILHLLNRWSFILLLPIQKFSQEMSTINTRVIPKLRCNIYFHKDESTKEFQLSIKDCSRYGGNMCCGVLSHSVVSDSLWPHRP